MSDDSCIMCTRGVMPLAMLIARGMLARRHVRLRNEIPSFWKGNMKCKTRNQQRHGKRRTNDEKKEQAKNAVVAPSKLLDFGERSESGWVYFDFVPLRSFLSLRTFAIRRGFGFCLARCVTYDFKIISKRI